MNTFRSPNPFGNRGVASGFPTPGWNNSSFNQTPNIGYGKVIVGSTIVNFITELSNSPYPGFNAVNRGMFIEDNTKDFFKQKFVMPIDGYHPLMIDIRDETDLISSLTAYAKTFGWEEVEVEFRHETELQQIPHFGRYHGNFPQPDMSLNANQVSLLRVVSVTLIKRKPAEQTKEDITRFAIETEDSKFLISLPVSKTGILNDILSLAMDKKIIKDWTGHVS